MRPRARAAARVRLWVSRWLRGDSGWAGESLRILLAPAEMTYAALVRLRMQLYSAGILRSLRSPIPVFSVGNLSLGGTGKTPFSAWLAGRLLERGGSPVVVSGGYGRDEVLLHRHLNPRIPMLTASRRIDAARLAASQGHDCVVVDDGFQHRRLARNCDIVLVAAESWAGTRRLLPRGPWREAPAALRRADLVIVTRKTATFERAGEVARAIAEYAPETRIGICEFAPSRVVPLHGGLESGALPLSWLDGREGVAVSTLADPEPFYEQLRSGGALIETATFPDHHEFDVDDLADLATRLRGRVLFMTWKEGVKLRSSLPRGVEGYVLEQEVRLEEASAELDHLLDEALVIAS